MMITKIFYILKFIKHNKEIFKKKKFNTNNIILMENFNYLPSIISYSYFSNILANIYQAKIISYNTNFFNFKYLLNYLLQIKFIDSFNILKSFNVTQNIIPKKNNSETIKKFYSQNLKLLKNKKDILRLKFYNIKVGDLIYDQYLRKYNLPTIDIKSKKFKNFLYSFIQLFFFWHIYFNNNKVKAVIASHTVYSIGIIPRIAIFYNIKAYNVGVSYAYALSKKNYLRLSGFENYRKNYFKIKKYLKKDLIKISKKKFCQKISGKNSTVNNIIKNIPHAVFNEESIKQNKNIKLEKKILIATHCFTDAVHAYGDALFVDFYEWLNYLGELSNTMNYKWIIKIHPSEYSRNIEHMNYFLKKYKNFSLIDKEKSHNEIISENRIMCVLTVYGSVGYEYPFFGIPVINASTNNPHQAYNFNYNPSSIYQYKNLIKNIEKLKNNFKSYKNEIYEYYYIRFLSEYHTFKNPERVMEKLGKEYSSPLIFREWINQFSLKLHQKRINDYSKFIKSNKFRMYADNLSKDSNYLKI